MGLAIVTRCKKIDCDAIAIDAPLEFGPARQREREREKSEVELGRGGQCRGESADLPQTALRDGVPRIGAPDIDAEPCGRRKSAFCSTAGDATGQAVWRSSSLIYALIKVAVETTEMQVAARDLVVRLLGAVRRPGEAGAGFADGDWRGRCADN